MPKLTDADAEERVCEFFRRLYANVEDGWLEVRNIKFDDKDRRSISEWFPIPDGKSAFLHAYECAMSYNQCGWDCFFGVNPRRRYGQNDADVLKGVATWADIDGIPSVETAEGRLGNVMHPVSPDAAVFSGQGLHVYWVLSEPYDPAANDFIYYRNGLKGAAKFYDGDRQSTNIGRVLRFPLSFSHKRGVFTKLWLRGAE